MKTYPNGLKIKVLTMSVSAIVGALSCIPLYAQDDSAIEEIQVTGSRVRALFGYLAENSTTTLAGTTTDQAQSRTRPEWSGIASGTYNIGPWGFTLQGQYFDAVMNNINWVEGVDIDDNRIASYTIWNTRIGYRSETNGGTQWRASFNITNMFDRDPSIVAGTNGQSLLAARFFLARL